MMNATVKTFLVVLASAVVLAAQTQAPGAHGPDKGWLFLEGGSYPLDPVVAQAFVKLAGGPDKKFVFIPTATDEARLDLSKTGDYTAVFGTKNLTVLHTRDRSKANSEEVARIIRNADAVWMGGGKPQNLYAAYNDTRVLTELQALLNRGGVVGGSSAGAMIQPSMMANGVKRRATGPVYLPAFGFLKNAITLVHVEQRHTDEDLLDVAKTHPELLCIGIDTATAIEVQGDVFSVVGVKRVQVVKEGKVLTLSSGDRFNMRTMMREPR